MIKLVLKDLPSSSSSAATVGTSGPGGVPRSSSTRYRGAQRPVRRTLRGSIALSLHLPEFEGVAPEPEYSFRTLPILGI